MGLKMESGAYVGTKGSISSNKKYNSRKELLTDSLNMPPKAELVLKTFVRRKVSNQYEDFKIGKMTNGNYYFAADKKGRTKGEHAVYFHEIGCRGGKINLYKDSYYSDGTLKHRKYKIRNRKRIQK